MALGPNGRRASRNAPGLSPEEKSIGRVAINAENSALVERFRRDRTNVRSYKRTSKQKLKWTSELHQCFIHAVEKLGGQDKATPKRILQHMNRDGITIAHIKSHLQMFRCGKINAEGLSKSDYKSWEEGQWQSNNAGPQGESVISSEPEQSNSRIEDFDPAKALMQLMEDSGRSSDSGAAAEELLRASPDNQISRQPYLHKKFKAKERLEDAATRPRGFAVELSDTYMQNSPNSEQEIRGQTSTYRPNPWPSPCSDHSFLCETSTDHLADVTGSLSGSKRKAEDVELNLTMATGSSRPSLQFASDPTPEEAALSLALS